MSLYLLHTGEIMILMDTSWPPLSWKAGVHNSPDNSWIKRLIWAYGLLYCSPYTNSNFNLHWWWKIAPYDNFTDQTLPRGNKGFQPLYHDVIPFTSRISCPVPKVPICKSPPMYSYLQSHIGKAFSGKRYTEVSVWYSLAMTYSDDWIVVRKRLCGKHGPHEFSPHPAVRHCVQVPQNVLSRLQIVRPEPVERDDHQRWSFVLEPRRALWPLLRCSVLAAAVRVRGEPLPLLWVAITLLKQVVELVIHEPALVFLRESHRGPVVAGLGNGKDSHHDHDRDDGYLRWEKHQ